MINCRLTQCYRNPQPSYKAKKHLFRIMPLPPALAARLAKRGIIKNAEVPKEKKAAEPSLDTEEAKSESGN